ncbi:histidine kinase [Nitrogeniibacter mangrovi]|uniref:Histidine kinase n=1 Tax=Nitrogeniibacter mangrovi TaxID=2016596 RepID=A0A6C1B6W4_9RHOO|nr:CHASE3 domain-containing protein [Nitrogeniibacter mangrovi]QID19506.1 histidine kinase [Nitrogeniibacter mangrovi]
MKHALPPVAEVGRTVRRWRDLLMILGGVVVLVVSALSVWQAMSSERALAELDLQAERLGRLDSLLIRMVEAESGVRGYLLSRKKGYLTPYFDNLTAIEYTLEQIRHDVGPGAQDQEDLAQLTGLVTLKLRILASAVSQGNAGTEAPPGRAEPEGLRYMEKIRMRVAALKYRMATRAQQSLDRSIVHIRSTRWVVAVLSVVAVLLLVWLYVLQQRQARLGARIDALLRTENDHLEAQVRARTAELSDLASYLTDTREAEQARLARELHDELGALLTAAKMDAGWIGRKLDGADADGLRERIERLKGMLDEGIALKRRITDGLRPPLLEELGLSAALQELAEDFARRDGVAVALSLPEAPIELPPDRALALYRIAQEALTNVRRHARATQVSLRLACTATGIELTVEDDGVGFTPSAGAHHHGLAGMRHRMQMFAGRCDIASAPGAGTRIHACMPPGP